MNNVSREEVVCEIQKHKTTHREGKRRKSWETTAALWSADQRQTGLMPVGVKKMYPVLICLCWDAGWDEREEAAAVAAA